MLAWRSVDTRCGWQMQSAPHKDVTEFTQTSENSQLVARQLAIELAHAPSPFARAVVRVVGRADHVLVLLREVLLRRHDQRLP